MERWAHELMASKVPRRQDEFQVALHSATTEICRLRARVNRQRSRAALVLPVWPEDEVSS
mgnify:FL=1